MNTLACLAGLLAATGPTGAGAAPVPVAAGEYELATETLLPHLEEALRYANTRTRRCLRQPEATGIFPLLQHQAFTGCTLVPPTHATDNLRFTLQCRNPEAASGAAVFEVEAESVAAVLEVKMGGKNMTLSQRVRGRRLGPCAETGAR